MIHKIEVENFRSFNQKITIDFTVKPKKAQEFGYSQSACEQVVTRRAVFFGANGSGKSNVLKAMTFLGWFISSSTKDDAFKLKYLPFFVPFCSTSKLPTYLATEFSDGEVLWRYEVALSYPLSVLHEKLLNKQSKRADWNTVFERRLKDQDYSFPDTDKSSNWNKIPQRPDASLISSMVQLGKIPQQEAEEYEIAKKICTFLENSCGRVDSDFDEPQTVIWHNTGTRLKNDPELLNVATDFVVNRADLGVKRISVEDVVQEDSKTNVKYQLTIPKLTHAIGDKEFDLPYRLESGGTRLVLEIIAGIHPRAKSSGLIIFDEIDRSIHPHLLPKLIDLMTPSDTKSQSIMVTHSDFLMRFLEQDQIFLTEKNADGSTIVYRSNEVKGFKSDLNTQAWYHAGKLGGIPRL
jgi:AAA15 family ATPase/GTPase